MKRGQVTYRQTVERRSGTDVYEFLLFRDTCIGYAGLIHPVLKTELFTLRGWVPIGEEGQYGESDVLTMSDDDIKAMFALPKKFDQIQKMWSCLTEAEAF